MENAIESMARIRGGERKMSCHCRRDEAQINVMDVEMTEFGFEWIKYCEQCEWSVICNVAVDWEYVEEVANT